MNKMKTRVLDIGARYGLHESWKNFLAPITYDLIEADPIEADRLCKRYAEKDNIFIHNMAMADKDGHVELNRLVNVAMSGALPRLDVSPLYWGEREQQMDVVDKVRVTSKSLDTFRLEQGYAFDFLKLDTEGTEYDILRDFSYFSEILAVRSEVCFDHLFEGTRGDTFTDIHRLLQKNNFILLNIDYDGKGDFYSNMIDSRKRYGVLQQTDAVWVKPPKGILEAKEPYSCLKLICFLFLNNSPDMALWLLKEASDFLCEVRGCSLSRFAEYCVISHLYTLKWVPGQSIIEHKEFFESIFNREYPDLNKYNENSSFNPIESVLSPELEFDWMS